MFITHKRKAKKSIKKQEEVKPQLPNYKVVQPLVLEEEAEDILKKIISEEEQEEE